ncbi:hypothetical protein HJC23_001149 [Cyclotella cryptica]|uniref:Uncharacterized protein n=1 Tax=Cyclotella cryptica TaxID=29204 RepID=A0ABD3P6B6_9STRA|eukprot:CCRYP_017380-RA/>CCRYP_017380-RA protein AED:0.37 eAED:0.37 QI:0/-1/0/1/-1/1/1/0/347
MFSKRIIIVVSIAIAIRPLINYFFWLKASPLDKAVGPVPVLSKEQLSSHVKGKNALLVGGTRGVGYGTALALAAAGARVTIVGRSANSGSRAVTEIKNAIDSGAVNFISGDIGTVCDCMKLIRKLEEQDVRYDFLVVSAATFPDWTQPLLNEDGVDKSFGIATVGRYLVYRNAHRFMKSGSRILNVLASGTKWPSQVLKMWNRDLASGKKEVSGLYEGILNFALSSEMMMDSLYKYDKNFVNGAYTMVSTHPGILKTDLHRGQGLLFDIIEAVMVALVGISEEDAGKHQASILVSEKLHEKRLTFVDQFGYGRLRDQNAIDFIEENSEWLWSLLTTLEEKSGACSDN